VAGIGVAAAMSTRGTYEEGCRGHAEADIDCCRHQILGSLKLEDAGIFTPRLDASGRGVAKSCEPPAARTAATCVSSEESKVHESWLENFLWQVVSKAGASRTQDQSHARTFLKAYPTPSHSTTGLSGIRYSKRHTQISGNVLPATSPPGSVIEEASATAEPPS